jgi:hypothetical protein
MSLFNFNAAGMIRRRMLINFRVDPLVLAAALPEHFEPLLVDGWGIVGICFIELERLGPSRLSFLPGLRSLNIAHRAAVQWRDRHGTRSGVYIWRRDTSSRLNALAGGRWFSGVHRQARFELDAGPEALRLAVELKDGGRVDIQALPTKQWRSDSVFEDACQASAFFEKGSLGISPARKPGTFEAMELRINSWSTRPLEVRHATSTFFSDPRRFPEGTVMFDCGLLMEQTPHEWHVRRFDHTAVQA